MYNEIIDPDKVLLELPIDREALRAAFLIMVILVAFLVWLSIECCAAIGWANISLLHYFFMAIGIGTMTIVAVGLFSPPEGIIFTADGFYDYSPVRVQWFVAWKDVTLITTRGNFLLVRLRNPKEYIARERNLFRLHLQWLDYFLMGTPITISPYLFRMRLKELKRIMTEQYENYRERVSATDNTDSH
jgi:hypothetical protein